MTLTIEAGCRARERYLTALRLHEADLAKQRAEGLGAYELAGLVARLRRTIEDEAHLTERETA